MNVSDPDLVHEWNIDTSWQDWPHGAFWNSPPDSAEPSPKADPTATASPTIAQRSPLPIAGRSMFDVERSLPDSQ